MMVGAQILWPLWQSGQPGTVMPSLRAIIDRVPRIIVQSSADSAVQYAGGSTPFLNYGNLPTKLPKV